MLSAQEEKWVEEQRFLMNQLLVLLGRVGATEADALLMQQTIHRLSDMFLLVVAGNFNSGKRFVPSPVADDHSD